MRKYAWSWLIVGPLLAVAVACQPPSPEEEAAVITVPAVVTPVPTDLPTPTSTPLPTATPIPQPTATAEARALPDGWKEVGGEAVGLQAMVPESWVNLVGISAAHDITVRLGPHKLLLADSPPTGANLLAGQAPGDGVFVIGFMARSVIGSDLLASNPNQIAQNLLDAWEERVVPLSPIQSLPGSRLPAAYVDIDREPFELLPATADGLLWRMVVFVRPTTNTPAILLMAAIPEQWAEREEALETILQSVIIHEVDGFTVVGELRSGGLVDGRLGRAATDVWTLRGVSGQYATITLTPIDNNIDLTLALVDPAGITIESVDSGYAGEMEYLVDVLLRDDGVYYVKVREFFNEAGRYKLSLLLADKPQFGGGGRLSFGEEVTRDLPQQGEHAWVFNGNAGQLVTLILTPLDPQLDIILALRDPGGRELVRLDEGFSGDAELLVGYALPVTGEYTVLVRGFDGHGGRYSLSLDEGGESTANFWEAGDLVYGDVKREVLRQNEVHAWFFAGETGDEVTIVVTPLDDNLDVDVWLLDPDVQKLAAQDEFLSGEKETINYTLPADGEYIVLVREFFGEAGPYEISLTAGGSNFLEQMGTLNYGEAVTGNLPAGKRAVWSFAGEEGDLVNIILSPLDTTGDWVIALLSPDGETAIMVDDTIAGSAERLEEFELTASGLWSIVVQEFFDNGGRYELSLTVTE